jgi:hypothetical protein
VTRIIVRVGNRPIARDSYPQAGQVNAFDRPEVNEAALVDEIQGLSRGRKSFGRRQVKSPRAMRF